MKIPFLNKQQYIVLKCYTNNSVVAEALPISNKPPLMRNKPTKGKTFKSCYGRLMSEKRSATVRMWQSLRVRSGEDGITMSTPDGNLSNFDYSHNYDEHYRLSGMSVVKIMTPWVLQEATGVEFVHASHIRNTSQMRIPSGIVNFKHQHAITIFNLISDHPHEYMVSAGAFLTSLYPLSDKPLHVEAFYDVKKHEELYYKAASKMFFDNNLLRVKRLYDREER